MKIKVENFDLEATITSGSCFRVTKEDDGSFTTILKDRVVNIKQDNNYLILNSSNEKDIESLIKEYFDLNRDYNSINKEIIKKM